MALKLTWDDLIIENLNPTDAANWLAEWKWLVSGRVAPIFLTKFGDWFLQRPDGSVEMLDVLEGSLEKVADTNSEFRSLVNDRAWQEENLLSLIVLGLHEEGKVPASHQCYAVAPHPVLGGKLESKYIMVMDIPVWQSICAQTLQSL